MNNQIVQKAGLNSLAAIVVGAGIKLLNDDPWAGIVLILGGIAVFTLREYLKQE